MGALNFEPVPRRGFWRTASFTRLAVLVAATVGLSVCLWGVWPQAGPPATRPARPALPPVRPIPASLPALSGEDLTILAEVRDREPVRELPYYYLLKRAGQATARPAAILVEAEDLVAFPETFRGRPVSLKAVFLREYEVELPENLAGLRRVRTGEVGSPSGTITTFVLPRTEPSGCRWGDDVRVTGYFLQVRRYVTDQGERGAGTAHDGPLIIAQSLECLTRQERVPVWRALLFAAGALVAIGAVAAVTIAKQHRTRRRRDRARTVP